MEEIEKLIQEFIKYYGDESKIIEDLSAKLSQVENQKQALEEEIQRKEETYIKAVGLAQRIIERGSAETGKSELKRKKKVESSDGPIRNFSGYYQEDIDKNLKENIWKITFYSDNIDPLETKIEDNEDKKLIGEKPIVEAVKYILDGYKAPNMIEGKKHQDLSGIVFHQNSTLLVDDDILSPGISLKYLVSKYKPKEGYINLDIKITTEVR